MNKNQVQNEVQSFWDSKPCGSENSDRDPENREYYEEIESERYQYQGHILWVLDWIDWSHKRILEIGTGVGTDARQLIARGANYMGINVDQGSVNATLRALSVFGLPGEVKQCSATDLQFPDASFDAVYSFGVLHHIPEVEKAVNEIYRVLKPGGSLLIMLYNRNSINYQIEIRVLRKMALRLLALPGAASFFGWLGFPRKKLERHVELYRKFGRVSNAEWLSRNTDGPDNPYSTVFNEAETRSLLKDFHIQRTVVDFFDYRHLGVLGRMMPTGLVTRIGRQWGWHRIVLAVKPT